MTDLAKPQPQETRRSRKTAGVASGNGQIVLVLQGGGALGAFQAGVYHALHDAGIEPDWVIGTSIGAINASIIVGNEPDNRLAALQEFWQRVARQSIWGAWSPQIAQSFANWMTITAGLPGFFAPNPFAFLGAHVPLGADNAGYYTTAPLERTLSEIVDFSLIKRNKPRLTVGAAHVETSQMHYFDSLQTEIDVKHVLASGALPPAFPAVCINGEHYWDGGILSNTPAEAVFDDNPRRNSLVFAVHMWNPAGPAPQTMWEVLHRQKDIQYSSRVATHIARQAQIHRLRHVIKELAAYLPEETRNSEEVQALAAYGCLTRMHFVRLLSPRFDNEDHTKDIDFSPAGIRQRWQSGYDMAMRAIESAPWNGDFDPHEGVFLHEPKGSMPLTAVASSEGMGQPISLASDQYATNPLPSPEISMAFTNDHLMHVAPMRLGERKHFMSAVDDHSIRIVPNPKRLRASLDGRVVADTVRALTLFEASYPGVHYVPGADVDTTVLRRSTHKTRCPFKGEASYYSIVTADGIAENAIWTYENPLPVAAKIAGYLAFDTARVDLFEGVKV